MSIRFGDVEHGRAILEAGWGGQAAAFNPGAHRVISRVIDGKLAGGVVYRDYFIASIGIHTAIFTPKCLGKDFLWVIFHYPLVQLGCQKAIAKLPTCNLASVHLARRLGFSEVAVIDGVYPGSSQTVLELDRDSDAAQRWLNLDCEARRKMEAARQAGV